MGRVWASVRLEFRLSWSLLPFAKGDLSRPWDTTVHDAGVGVAVLTVVKSVGSISERWRFKGPMRTTSKTRGALDEEVGFSDRDLFNLKDYQSL